MADPGVDELFIQFNGVFVALIPSLIIGIGIELISPIGTSNEMYDCLVPAISQLYGAPSSFIK